MADVQRMFGNRYRIVRHIARGGMAQVYLARDLLLDRPVALKALFPELSVDEAFVERFRREAQAAANLSHPNIVAIYDWGQGDSTYYIVMEFVDGETLSARIRRGPMPAGEAAAVGIATAAALSFAHSHNVIHRDVKPGNVLIDKSGHVKVADFGIARAVGAAERITQAGAVMGTATYFSPEQAQGQTCDARSDVYSLGVVLYEMAVGTPPFVGDNPVAIALQHVGQRPPAPRTANPSIPPGYEAITLRAMAKDPGDRYQSAAELRADLERFRAGQSVAGTFRDSTVALRVGDGRMGTDATIAMSPAPVAVGAAATTGGRRAAATTISRPRHTAGDPPRDRNDDTGPLVARRSRRGALVVGVLLLLVALAVLGYVIGRDYGYFGGLKTLTVPSVAGQPVTTATATLQSEGFTHVVEKKVTSPTIPAGTAIATDPAAGSREKSNVTVALDVSLGRKPVEVPSVDGKAQAAAVAALKQQGFVTSVGAQADNSVPKGDVIRTSPPGGTMQKPGSKVHVLVSSGPVQVQIPNVTFDPPVQAGAILSGLGFRIKAEMTEASRTVQFGDVTRTSPAAGSAAPYGSAITVYVSTGPATVTLPSLLGKTEPQAAAKLYKLGLNADFTSVPVTTPGQNGLVQSTSPLPGFSVDKGRLVEVAIGLYTAPTTTTTTLPVTTTTLPVTTTTVPTFGISDVPDTTTPPVPPGGQTARRTRDQTR